MYFLSTVAGRGKINSLLIAEAAIRRTATMGIEVVSNCFLIHIFCTLTSLYRGSALLCPKLNNMMYRLPKFCRTYRLFLENDLPAPYCDGFMEYIQYSTMVFSNFSNNKIKSINFVKLLDLENFVLFLQNRVWLGSKHNFEDPIIANNIEKVHYTYRGPRLYSPACVAGAT